MARKRIHPWLGCLGLMLVTMFVATTGARADTTGKPYKVILPTTVGVGPSQTITATFTNLTSPQSMGSANLTAPAGYDLTGVTTTQGAVALSGSTVHLRSLSLAPGKSVTVTMTADVACNEAASTWTPAAKQANDFSGTGNDFFLNQGASSLSTKPTSACETSEACPEDVDCEEFLSYRGVLELPATSGAGAAGGLLRVAAVQQVNYQLTLASKAYFTTTLPDEGTLDFAFETRLPINCAAYEEIAPVYGIVSGPVNRTKSVSFVISASLMDAYQRDAADLEMCFGAPQPFLTDPTKPTLSTGVVRGQTWFVGVLPDCVGDAVPASEPNTAGVPQASPCVYDRRFDLAGNGLLSVYVPFTYPDPAYRG